MKRPTDTVGICVDLKRFIRIKLKVCFARLKQSTIIDQGLSISRCSDQTQWHRPVEHNGHKIDGVSSDKKFTKLSGCPLVSLAHLRGSDPDGL